MKRHSSLILALFLAAVLLMPGSVFSDEPSIAGHWEGSIDVPTMKLEVDVDLIQKNGTWTGDISIPVQNAKDLPLGDIAVEGMEVTFAISGVPGDPTFKGQVSADGKKITGDFTQGGQTFPFELSREAEPAAKARKALDGFGEVIEKAMETFNVPGLAIAVVKDKEIVMAEGFGYRDVDQKLPVTPDTLMAIGSATKAFTTFALGTLVDEGKVEWDEPLQKYIPWFRLQDPMMGLRLTPRDLVTHRSGLPRHDLVWYNNLSAEREDLVRRLAYLEPTADLRERFQYNNLMFLTAGYLIETLTGNPWEDSVRDLVFEPLEMTRSNFSVEASQKDSDFAQPYREKDDKIEKIPFRNITTVGPAGSINSCVSEMSHWVMVHLNNGKFLDKQVINATTLVDMHSSHMPTGGTPTRPDITPPDYGLGWMVDNYRGHKRVHHGGAIDGFSAMVSMLPSDGFGFVVLINRSGAGLHELLVRTAADRLLGLDPVDWLGEAAKRLEEGKKAAEEAEQKKMVRKIAGTQPAHKLADYAGIYEDSGYGKLEVGLKENMLFFAYNGITTPLDHWHYETFSGGEADDPTFEDMKLTFRTDVNGHVASVEAPFEPTTDEIVFMKKPDVRFFDPEYLQKFTGDYEIVSQKLAVSLKGDVLTLSAPGQPSVDLVPVLGGEFELKQIKVISLKFIEDEQGKVTGIEVYQPNGIYEAKRIEEEPEKE